MTRQFGTCQLRDHLRNQYENGERGVYLIGDSGYLLEPWLLTPYSQYNESTPEAEYNIRLKRVRNVIERTNGVLKAKF